MELKMVWMYHDLMDLYGDKGNIQVIKTRCEKRGIKCIVDTCTLQQDIKIEDYDLFFLGGGADKEQNMIYEDLCKRKASIEKALKNQTAFLLICGGYQLFGQYYKDQDGKMIDGLKIFDYYTEANGQDNRCIGNIAIETNIDGELVKVVGFENHGGMTKNVTTPFGKVLKGHGNVYQGQFEGFMNEQVIATYMHGPLLPKNPKVADLVIKRALKKRYKDVTLEPLDDVLEEKACQTMLNRMNIKDV